MRLGDTAADAQRHDEAISHYTITLSVNSGSPQDTLLKRSKVYLACGSFEHALNDANQVFRLFLTQMNSLNQLSSGDRTRSIVSMGLRDEARSVTQSRRLQQCCCCVRGDALEDDGVTYQIQTFRVSCMRVA